MTGGDVRNALCRIENGQEVRLVAHPLQCRDAVDEIRERRRPSGLDRRGDFVIGETVLRNLEQRSKTLLEEREQIAADRGVRRITVRGESEVDELIDTQADLPHIAIEEDLHDALRRATKRERIARSGGTRADAKESREC